MSFTTSRYTALPTRHVHSVVFTNARPFSAIVVRL
jgi:hypothetical protein